jgi:hypothetical protein
MSGTAAASSELQVEAANANSSRMPLWEAPEAWLRLLVNGDDLMLDLPEIMSANWAMCEATLRSMTRWRLWLKV